LRGQAGILAGTLSPGEPCPVCGSREHPEPAKVSDEDLTEVKVRQAKDLSENARGRRDKKAAECAALNAEIEIRKKRFTADLSEFVPDTPWDQAGEKLTDTLAAVQKAMAALTSDKEAQEKALSALTKNWDDCTKEKNDSEASYRSAVTLTEERKAREQESLNFLNEAESQYLDAIEACQFTDEKDYTAALVTEDELAEIKKQIADHEKTGDRLLRDIKRLEDETKGKEQPDTEKLKADIAAVGNAIECESGRRDETKSRLDQTIGKLTALRRASEEFDKAEREYAAVRQLSDTANGKLDFETYAQLAYFERVLRAANKRLKIMSQNRYMLLRKEDSDDKRSKMGLELEVADSYTGKRRSANSLSGGESFMASLSLALGLSDVVQQSAGGIHLDAMFIDEGFGSLDSEVLELAIRTLQDMAGCGRIIGVISHVAELRERIEKQVLVEKTTAGSKIRMIG
jgi:exonuclease SbcC